MLRIIELSDERLVLGPSKRDEFLGLILAGLGTLALTIVVASFFVRMNELAFHFFFPGLVAFPSGVFFLVRNKRWVFDRQSQKVFSVSLGHAKSVCTWAELKSIEHKFSKGYLTGSMVDRTIQDISIVLKNGNRKWIGQLPWNEGRSSDLVPRICQFLGLSIVLAENDSF